MNHKAFECDGFQIYGLLVTKGLELARFLENSRDRPIPTITRTGSEHAPLPSFAVDSQRHSGSVCQQLGPSLQYSTKFQSFTMDLPFNASGLDFGKLKRSYLSAGTSAMVYLTHLPGGVKVVLKSPHKFPRRDKLTESLEKESLACLKREIEVFRHLGPHPYIIRFIAACGDELLLEYHPKGCLTQYLGIGPRPSTPLVLMWAAQLGEALVFIHNKDVIHGDFSPHNVLVTHQRTLVLTDFAGSPFRGHAGLVCYGTRYTSPKYDPNLPRKQDDIFAFGSVLYEISFWECLFPEITLEDEWRIKEAYKAGEFPDVSAHVLGNIICHCWHSKFENAEALLKSIRDLAVDGQDTSNLECRRET